MKTCDFCERDEEDCPGGALNECHMCSRDYCAGCGSEEHGACTACIKRLNLSPAVSANHIPDAGKKVGGDVLTPARRELVRLLWECVAWSMGASNRPRPLATGVDLLLEVREFYDAHPDVAEWARGLANKESEVADG